MAVVQSGADTTQLTIDATSKAARVTLYDVNGYYRGQKATYRAATNGTFAPGASTTKSFFAIFGSSTKKITVQRIRLTSMASSGSSSNRLVLRKSWTGAPTGGTATTLTQVPLDSNFAAGSANIVKVWTAEPTTDITSFTNIGSVKTVSNTTTTLLMGDVDYDFRHFGGHGPNGIVLNGVREGLVLAFLNSVTITAVCVTVEWTEE